MLRSYYDILTPYLPLMVKGLGATATITLLSLVAGTALGAGIYAMTKSRRLWVRKTAQCYRFIVRGTPIMVFLLLFYYIVLQGSWGVAAAVLVTALVVGIVIILFDTVNLKFGLVKAETLSESVLYGTLKDFGYLVFPYLKQLLLKQ